MDMRDINFAKITKRIICFYSVRACALPILTVFCICAGDAKRARHLFLTKCDKMHLLMKLAVSSSPFLCFRLRLGYGFGGFYSARNSRNREKLSCDTQVRKNVNCRSLLNRLLRHASIALPCRQLGHSKRQIRQVGTGPYLTRVDNFLCQCNVHNKACSQKEIKQTDCV